MSAVTAQDFDRTSSLDEIYALLARLGMENGWAKKAPSLWPRPTETYRPRHWSYRPAKAALHAAGRFVNTELAERRNLILANPIPGNTYATVRTLVCAYQMVKAGETARSHRHTANALRMVLDTAPGTYTIVDGKKIPMEPGDVLLTPNWCWHAHSNESSADAYWMDVLDVPTVHLLNPMFFEHHALGLEPVTGIDGASPARFPWAETTRRLDEAAEFAPGCHRIELGDPAMATMGLEVTRIAAGAACEWPGTTSSAVMAIISGSGCATIGSEAFAFARGDAMAAPAGAGRKFQAESESYVLEASDKPLMAKLGWLREVPTG